MTFRYLPPTYREGGEISEIAMGTDDAMKVAQQILENAKTLARADGEAEFAGSLVLVEGVRPHGRAYLRIVANDDRGEAVEYGDTNQERRRILGRAGNVKIY